MSGWRHRTDLHNQLYLSWPIQEFPWRPSVGLLMNEEPSGCSLTQRRPHSSKTFFIVLPSRPEFRIDDDRAFHIGICSEALSGCPETGSALCWCEHHLYSLRKEIGEGGMNTRREHLTDRTTIRKIGTDRVRVETKRNTRMSLRG